MQDDLGVRQGQAGRVQLGRGTALAQVLQPVAEGVDIEHVEAAQRLGIDLPPCAGLQPPDLRLAKAGPDQAGRIAADDGTCIFSVSGVAPAT